MKRKFIIRKVTNWVWIVQGVGMQWGCPPVVGTCHIFVMVFNLCFRMLFNKVYISQTKNGVQRKLHHSGKGYGGAGFGGTPDCPLGQCKSAATAIKVIHWVRA